MAKEEGGLAAMFGGGPKGSDTGTSEGEDIARDILDAIKDDDAKALWLAIERAHEACAQGYDEGDDSDDEEA